MAEETRLTTDDLRSTTWKRLEKILNERLQRHREKNDGKLTVDDTNNLRGRIAELKAMLGLARERPSVAADSDLD